MTYQAWMVCEPDRGQVRQLTQAIAAHWVERQ